MRERTPAICIRTTDYSETSQIAHFMTRGCGVVRLLAKGSKRPKSATGGALDILSEGDLVYIPARSGSLGTLVEFAESVSHLPLRKDAGRLNIALYMIELTGELIAEGDVHEEVFDLLHSALGRLDAAESSPPAVLAYFQWRLLRHVGLLGQLTACVACGQSVTEGRGVRDPHFSSSQGGLLCGRCVLSELPADRVPVDGATLAGLAALAAAAAGQKVKLPDAQARAASRLLAYHTCQQIGKPLRMEKYAVG